MTTIHYTPPPDDAPERVLVWCPDTPGWWIGHSSDFVRRYWGRLCTAWKEQGPLPTPEAEPEPVVADEGEKVDPNEPVPLRVGMKVRLRSGTSKTHTVEAVGPGVAYGPGFRISARNVDRWVTDDGRPVCLPDEPAPAAPPFDLAGWIDEQHSAWALIQPCAFSDYLIEQALDLPAPAAPPLDLAAWLKAEKERWLLYGVGDTGDLFEWLVGAARGLSAPVDRQTAEAIVERCVVAARNMPNLDSIVQPSETTSAYRSGYNLAQQNACAAIRYVDLSDLPDPWEIVAKRIYGDEWHEDLAMGPSDLLPLIRPLWERAYTPEQIERAWRRAWNGAVPCQFLLAALRDGTDDR